MPDESECVFAIVGEPYRDSGSKIKMDPALHFALTFEGEKDECSRAFGGTEWRTRDLAEIGSERAEAPGPGPI